MIGRVVADPEIRQTQSGAKVASYRLAVDRNSADKEADFISCLAWNKGAEFAERFLRKGVKIAVEGRIQTGSYTKQDGSKVYTTDVVVDRHEFCESKNSAQPNASNTDSNAFNAQPNTFNTDYSAGFAELDSGEDLPF